MGAVVKQTFVAYYCC